MKSEAQFTPFSDPKNINWVLLSGLMAITVVVLTLMPQQMGQLSSAYSLMLWWGLFGLTLFRYVGKKGTIGFAIGSMVGVCLHIFLPLATLALV